MGSASATEEPITSHRGEVRPPMAFEGDEPSIIFAEEPHSLYKRKRAYSNNQMQDDRRAVHQKQVMSFWEGMCLSNEAVQKEQHNAKKFMPEIRPESKATPWLDSNESIMFSPTSSFRAYRSRSP